MFTSLVQTWRRQRAGSHAAESSVNGFLLTMILIHCIATRRLSRQSSYLQLFKGTLDYIASGGAQMSCYRSAVWSVVVRTHARTPPPTHTLAYSSRPTHLPLDPQSCWPQPV